MKEESTNRDQLDSIEISRNAKGNYTWKIKRYFDHQTDEPKLVVQSMKKAEDAIKYFFVEGGDSK